jgi:peptidoglycan/xylan/chitin deacetylase (PgdA/CDA1 family)
VVDDDRSRVVVVSVDVEPDPAMFVSGHSGLDEGLPRLADLFRRQDIPADYFFTLDAAQRIPDFLREQATGGRWFGSHGIHHAPAFYGRQPISWQERMMDDATEGLAGLAGARPRMFRAPNFSVSGAILQAAVDLGYRVDSSVLPGRVKRRYRVFPVVDHRGAPRDPYPPDERHPPRPGNLRIWEVPVTENPCAPGGPIGLGFVNAERAETALRAVRESSGWVITILCHPWEAVDLGKRHPNLPPWLATTCREDLRSFETFLQSLRSEYEFQPLRTVVDGLGAQGSGLG